MELKQGIQEIRAGLKELISLVGNLIQRNEKGLVLSMSPPDPKLSENTLTDLERDSSFETQAAGQGKEPKIEEEKTPAKQKELKEGKAETPHKGEERPRSAKKKSKLTKVKTGLFGTYRFMKQCWNMGHKQTGLTERIIANIEKISLRSWELSMRDFRRNRLKGTVRDLRASDVRSPG